MALWLELIPKLHKSDHLDARYHQLDDWDNLTSFEAEGTRHTAHSDLLTTTTSSQPVLTQSSTPGTTQSSSTTTTTAATTTSTTTAAVGAELPGSSGSTYVRQQQSVDDSQSTDVSTVSLSITIAVGSFLLFINILVFVAVYYQKDRIRRERRRHKADMRAASQHLNYRHDDVDGTVPRTDSLSSDVRSNLSLPYGYTPTDVVDYPPTATRSARSNHHHHQYLGGVTLPRLSSPPAVVDAPAYGTVRSRAIPRWSATSDQVEMSTTTATTGLHTYSECVGHNGGLIHKCPVTTATGHHISSDVTSPLCASGIVTLDDARKPSTVV